MSMYILDINFWTEIFRGEIFEQGIEEKWSFWLFLSFSRGFMIYGSIVACCSNSCSTLQLCYSVKTAFHSNKGTKTVLLTGQGMHYYCKMKELYRQTWISIFSLSYLWNHCALHWLLHAFAPRNLSFTVTVKGHMMLRE